ncbi:MAG: alpha/beta fold hydrolase [Nocardioidaceae bacterium]
MSGHPRARRLGGIVGGAAGLVATGVAARVVAQRRAETRRRAERSQLRAELGSLRGRVSRLSSEDGVELHVEVDEPAGEPSGATVVFVHGYALNHDSWHYQRQALRDRHRLVFYDQRSHGRSARSDDEHSNLDQLGRDLGRVVDAAAPSGPVVLVGHSMGGMSIMALAEQRPDLFGGRVVGVALLATSAGDLGKVTLGLPGVPGRLVHQLAPAALATLARIPAIAESGRKAHSELGYMLTQRYAFGGHVPHELAEFTDDMLASTPIGVVAAFFPVFAEHDRYAALAALRHVDVLVVSGDVDQLTPLTHGREIAHRLPSAEFLELTGAGHMLMLERPDEVNRALAGLVDRAAAKAVA